MMGQVVLRNSYQRPHKRRLVGLVRRSHNDEPGRGEALISGPIRDQAALYGVLTRCTP